MRGSPAKGLPKHVTKCQVCMIPAFKIYVDGLEQRKKLK